MKICMDIETEPFSKNFNEAQKNGQELFAFMPKPRVACVYIDERNEYMNFFPDEFSELLKLLKKADKVITYNGKHFDFKVILKHVGKTQKSFIVAKEKHVDLLDILHGEHGYRVSLNDLAYVNLNEKKHTDGRKMESLSVDELIVACQSDVSQTFRLYNLHETGELKYPPRRTRQRRENPSDYDGSGELMYVHYTKEEIDKYTAADPNWEIDLMEDMTEGQWADWMAGWR